jgi:hypothetical protein
MHLLRSVTETGAEMGIAPLPLHLPTSAPPRADHHHHHHHDHHHHHTSHMMTNNDQLHSGNISTSHHFNHLNPAIPAKYTPSTTTANAFYYPPKSAFLAAANSSNSTIIQPKTSTIPQSSTATSILDQASTLARKFNPQQMHAQKFANRLPLRPTSFASGCGPGTVDFTDVHLLVQKMMYKLTELRQIVVGPQASHSEPIPINQHLEQLKKFEAPSCELKFLIEFYSIKY